MPYLKTIQHFKKKFKHKLENVCEKFNCRRPISYGSWLQFIVYFLGWIVFRKVYSYQVELALFLGLEIQCRSCHGIHRYGFWDGWVTLLFIVHILALRCIASWGVEFDPSEAVWPFFYTQTTKLQNFEACHTSSKFGLEAGHACFVLLGKVSWLEPTSNLVVTISRTAISQLCFLLWATYSYQLSGLVHIGSIGQLSLISCMCTMVACVTVWSVKLRFSHLKHVSKLKLDLPSFFEV